MSVTPGATSTSIRSFSILVTRPMIPPAVTTSSPTSTDERSAC